MQYSDEEVRRISETFTQEQRDKIREVYILAHCIDDGGQRWFTRRMASNLIPGGVSKPTITRVLEKLVAEGWLEKEERPTAADWLIRRYQYRINPSRGNAQVRVYISNRVREINSWLEGYSK